MKRIDCNPLVDLYLEEKDITKAFYTVLRFNLKQENLLTQDLMYSDILDVLWKLTEHDLRYKEYKELLLIDLDYLPSAVYYPLVTFLKDKGFTVIYRDSVEVDMIMDRIKTLQKRDFNELLRRLNDYIE